MPTTLPEAVALIGTLLADPNLLLGLVTFIVILALSVVGAWLILSVRPE